METIKELNTKELEQINGGDMTCIIVGYSTTPEASSCDEAGYSTTDNIVGYGSAACAFIGLGFGVFEAR